MSEPQDLRGPILITALAMLALDALIVFLMAGGLRRFGRAGRPAAAAVALVILGAALVASPQAFAQDSKEQQTLKSTLETRLAYVITGDPEVDRDLREEGPVLVGDVELEPVVARDEGPLEEVAHPAVTVGQGLGHTHRAALAQAQSRERDADTGRRHPTFRVEDVGADRRSLLAGLGGHAILPPWARYG